MAKIRYLHEGHFQIGTQEFEPLREVLEETKDEQGNFVLREATNPDGTPKMERIDHDIPDKLADEIRRDYPHWHAKGFVLIEDSGTEAPEPEPVTT